VSAAERELREQCGLTVRDLNEGAEHMGAVEFPGGERRVMTSKLLDSPRLDALASDWLRKHRHGVDTSEAYDDLRALLADVIERAKELTR